MTYKSLVDYFKDKPKELKKIIDRIKINTKARLESTKVRNSIIKGETTNFDEHLMENFVPANNVGRNEYRELFIIEGKSAKGSASEGRFDRDTQAVFTLRGVPKNTFGLTPEKALTNPEIHSLVTILGCNIGHKFDIEKCKYDKIIIMADSDSDGFAITSFMCAFFLYHMPGIIKAGKLYKAVSPLYKIKSEYQEYVHNKQEFIKIFEKQIRKAIVIKDGDKTLNDSELENLLFVNRDYLEILERASSQSAINPEILEFVTIHRKDKNFMKLFKNKFYELDIDEHNVLSGIHDGKYQILIMDNVFEKRIKELEYLIFDLNKGNIYYHIFEKYNKNIDDRGLMTLGQFLSICQKFQPVIKTRYKGLGELQPEQLRHTTLDPNNRILIRLTISDISREMEKFNILHGSADSERKLMMENFKISRDDLDN